MALHLRLGSISTGTLVTRDLAEAFVFELKRLARDDTEDPQRKASVDAALAAVAPLLGDDEANTGAAGMDALDVFVNETAPDLLQSYCAPYTYFGSHMGDGADFGVWADIDSLEEAARFSDGVLKVDAGDEWPELPADVDYVMEVNDHGNVTLFDARSSQALWAAV